MRKVLDYKNNRHGMKIFFTCSLGTLFELYDFTLYILLLENILSPLFFPHQDPSISRMWGLISFSLSFIFAPIGSLLWGWIGDKYGRKKMLFYSLFLMGTPSFLIGCLPDYNKIGIAAPILLILFRILQALSSSGEIKGAKIYAVEENAINIQGFISGCLSASGGIGVLLAMGAAYIINSYQPQDGLWRIPFLCGGIIIGTCAFIRYGLKEPEIMNSISYANTSFLKDYWYLLKNNYSSFIQIFTCSAFLGTISYLNYGFMGIYYTKFLHMDKNQALMLNIFGMVITIISSIFGGILLNKVKVFHFLYLTLIATCLGTYVAFYLILKEIMILQIMAQFFLSLILGFTATSITLFMVQLFPYSNRCKGILFPYALGVALIGGNTPLICNLLINNLHYSYSPALWLIFIAMLNLFTLTYYAKEEA